MKRFITLGWTVVDLDKIEMVSLYDNGYLHVNGICLLGKEDNSIEKYHELMEKWMEYCFQNSPETNNNLNK